MVYVEWIRIFLTYCRKPSTQCWTNCISRLNAHTQQQHCQYCCER